MKKTSLKRIGKIGRRNIKANKELKELYKSLNITPTCEIKFKGCAGMFTTGFAHRHERVWYRKQPELLSSYYQTVIACTPCHTIIDRNKKLREEVFIKLRGEEKL